MAKELGRPDEGGFRYIVKKSARFWVIGIIPVKFLIRGPEKQLPSLHDLIIAT